MGTSTPTPTTFVVSCTKSHLAEFFNGLEPLDRDAVVSWMGAMILDGRTQVVLTLVAGDPA